MKNPGINRCRNPHTLYALFLLCAAKLGIISRAGKPVTLKKPFSARPRSAAPPRHTHLKPVKTAKKAGSRKLWPPILPPFGNVFLPL